MFCERAELHEFAQRVELLGHELPGADHANRLVLTLGPGDIVIANNLTPHKVAGVRRAIEAVGAMLLYLPPYSPDLNPSELAFAKLKAIVRAARCRTIAPLWPLLGACLSRFNPDECRNYFRRAGYSAAKRS